MKPVCLVLGAGRGIGANVGTYFADHGYHACLVRRSNQEALNESIDLIQKAGNLATGYLMNLIEDDSVEDLIENILTKTRNLQKINQSKVQKVFLL